MVDRVVHDLCGKRVALLGESPTHGFGRTMALKAEITEQLIERCHYDAVFIESGAYDFLNVRKRLNAGQPVDQAMVAAAIGGLWAMREVEPLVAFLTEQARSGRLVLGGLDDQLGRGTYAQLQMPADLVHYLQGENRARCLADLQRFMLWQYTDQAPYGAEDRERILGCVNRIESGIRRVSGAAGRAEDLAMLDNLKRTIPRDFPVPGEPAGRDPATFNERDRSMYENFRWFMAHRPAHGKVIVWTAVTHAARELSTVPGREQQVPLGSYIHRAFGSQAFALAFSADSGSYARVGQPVRELPRAPATSLEARAFRGGDGAGDIRYLDADRLHALGAIPARVPGPGFTTARWDQVLDGLVVVRAERPPHPVGHPAGTP